MAQRKLNATMKKHLHPRTRTSMLLPSSAAALVAVLLLMSTLLVLASSSNETVAGECSSSEDATCASPLTANPKSADSSDAVATDQEHDDNECKDQDKDCQIRALIGDCGKYADFMLDNCRESCHVCGEYEEPPVVDEKPCNDKHSKCSFWTQRNHCETRTEYMLQVCPVSCNACATSIQQDTDFGVKQERPDTSDTTLSAKVATIIRESKTYMRKVRANKEYGTIRETCRNGNAKCSIWAAQGECQNNPAAMRVTCAPACHSCEMVDVEKRCPMDDTIHEENVLKKKGDLNALFERIVDDDNDENGFAKFKPRTIQRPYKSGDTRKRTWTLGPWMVALDEFLTDEECDRLIEVSQERGFGQSEEIIKKVKPDGSFERRISTYRTSSNTWCDRACQQDSLISGVIDRIANVTGVPEVNSEPLQVLKYENGDKYGEHADYIKYQKERPCGPRILTLLFYLSDDFSGGGTKFRFLRNYTVKPKKGMAILWPNVLNEDPMEEDELFDHEALPVHGGIKYAANAWLHMRDFKGNAEQQCV